MKLNGEMVVVQVMIDVVSTLRLVVRAIVLMMCVIILCECQTSFMANTDCPEPPPVANAYREWDVMKGEVNYTCFPTYSLTAGNLTRACSPADNFTYTGSTPVCTLDCRYTRNETYATLVNTTVAGDEAVYECTDNTTGSGMPGIRCLAVYGVWNHSAIDCHYLENIIQAGSAKLSPMPVNYTGTHPNVTIDGNSSTFLTLTPDSSLSFGIANPDGDRMEVSSVKLTLRVNFLATYAPCRVTRNGTEYNGSTTVKKTCQRWDSQSPHPHIFTEDDMFPADGGITEAQNYCRNPGGDMDRPWCLNLKATTSSKAKRICNIKACAQLKLFTSFTDKDGAAGTSVCSELNHPNQPYNLLNMVDEAKTLTITCRNVYTDVLPFGRRLTIQLSGNVDAVTVDVMDVEAFGRPYTEGCGPVVGYWGLQLVGPEPSMSNLGSNVTYQCQQGWHYRGGPLIAECLDSRDWSEPDLFQCTDEPNHALRLAEVFSLGESPLKLALGTCSSHILLPITFNVAVTLKHRVEVSEVLIVTASNNASTVVTITVTAGLEFKSWPCDTVTDVDPNGTHRSTCPVRPLSDRVSLTFSASLEDEWVFCDIIVLGQPFDSALQCLRTSSGTDFKGNWSMTTSGRQCQRWDSTQPHNHTYNHNDYFPDLTVNDAGNYCRTPIVPGERIFSHPWCYTSDNETEWEYCFIPQCDNVCRLRQDGADYKGAINVAVTGNPCDYWGDSHFLRYHYFSSLTHRTACRNPHVSQTVPWCYNRSASPQLCDIPSCSSMLATGWTLLDPDDPCTIPDWLVSNETVARECWTYDINSARQGSRFTSLDKVLQSKCHPSLLTIGVFCHLATANASSVWHQFWYNCTFPEETTTLATTQSATTAQTTQSVTTAQTTESVTTAKTTESVTTVQTTESATTAQQQWITTIPAVKVTMSPSCNCRKVCRTDVQQADVEEHVKKIKKELLVDKRILSATIRKKQSAEDDRPSAATTGYLGVVLFVLMIGLIIGADIISLVQYLKNNSSKTHNNDT